LLLTGVTVAGDGLFDLTRGIFGYLYALAHRRGHADALGAAQLEHGLGVFAEERRLDGHHGYLMRTDDLGEAAMDGGQALGVVGHFA